MSSDVRLPKLEEVRALAASLGMSLSDSEVRSYHSMMEGAFSIYTWMDTQEEPKPSVKYPRSFGYRPSREENPFNAWFWRTEIKGAPTGVLSDKRVGGDLPCGESISGGEECACFRCGVRIAHRG